MTNAINWQNQVNIEYWVLPHCLQMNQFYFACLPIFGDVPQVGYGHMADRAMVGVSNQMQLWRRKKTKQEKIVMITH